MAPDARAALQATWEKKHQAWVLEQTARLEAEAQMRLTEELRKAASVIDVQKKVGALLGWPPPKADPEEQP